MRKEIQVMMLVFVMLISAITPVQAAVDTRWRIPEDCPTPPAYGDRVYYRTHWMRFYINYGGYDLARTGQYAVPVGACWGPTFGIRGDPKSGYTAVDREAPYSVPGEVESYLAGFLELNPKLQDSRYWLCSPAFMKSLGNFVDIGGQKYWVNSAWPLSQNSEGSGQKFDVPVYVGDKLPDGSAPELRPRNDFNTPLCFKNGSDTFQIGAVNKSGAKRYMWCGKASYEQAGGNPPGGNIDLTQEYGSTLFKWLGGGKGLAGDMSSGYVTASFPYGIAVNYVKKQDDMGDKATYDWSIVNPTPLWLKNITVRVYTRGQRTGKWELVDIYPDIDLPPSTLDGKVKGKCPNKRVMLTSNGMWTMAQPRYFTEVNKPNEDYDLIVTANINLNIRDGQSGNPFPSIDRMDALYHTGATPPGVPKSEVYEFFNNATRILGIMLPVGYGDNVGWATDTAAKGGGWGTTPKEDPTSKPKNLAVTNIQLFRVDDQGNASPAAGNVEVNRPYKVKVTFKSSFDKGGEAKVRFYIRRESGELDLRQTDTVYFEPKGTVEKVWDWTGMREKVKLVPTVSYRWWRQQDKWEPGLFNGEREHTYEDNKLERDVIGTDIPDIPPTSIYWEYPLYYHPALEGGSEYITVWEKVPYEKEQPRYRIRTRLIK